MRIAVIAWGSLVHDRGQLETTGDWNADGPMLPVEYARISGRAVGVRRLTLVIKPGSKPIQTLYATCSRDTLDSALENLSLREGCPQVRIGFVNFLNQTSRIRCLRDRIQTELMEWNVAKNFEAIIWTDLPPNFYNITRTPCTFENVRIFLDSLSPEEREASRRYIQFTPPQVQTGYRPEIEAYFRQP